MCKNKTWKIRTRTSEEGVVLEIRTHPDWGWFENPRFWRTSFVGLNLWFVYVNSRARKYHYTICNRVLQKAIVREIKSWVRKHGSPIIKH